MMTRIALHLSSILVLSRLISVSGVCDNCLIGDSHCDQSTGNCWYGCKPGWTGNQCTKHCTIEKCIECFTFSNSTEICDKCEYGYYGDQCGIQCSKHCINGRCNSAGDCVFGCKVHWTGQKCNQQVCNFDNCEQCGLSETYYIPICAKCVEGMFYSYQHNNCVNCSSKCIGGQKMCNTSTGVCLAGCEKGVYGTNCDRNCTISNCDQCVLAYKNSDIAKCGLCSEGYYPQNLLCVPCSINCANAKCNASTGHCEGGCKFGWFGSKCDRKCTIPNCMECGENDQSNAMVCKECSPGMYYDFMNEGCFNCSENCIGGTDTCERNTGRCMNGCKPGFTGIQCKYLCGKCKDLSCYTNGTCVNGCETGWYTKFCTQQFPEHCADGVMFLRNGTCGDCQSYWYGDICDKKCSAQCRPSNYNGYVYCDKKTGRCDAGCLPGFYGDTCSLECSKNCNYGNCDMLTGECTHGCEYKYYGKHCDKLCPPNCSLPGCKIISGECTNCIDGFYGVNCTKKCSAGCKNGKCLQHHGFCQDGCISGYFGHSCLQLCGGNCLDDICAKDTGKCSSGCKLGFYGAYCTNPCKNCENSACNQMGGSCMDGCMPGTTGTHCRDVCPPSTYGKDCKNRCTSCRNEACDPVTGECTSGCAVGFTGHLCQDEVPLSYSRRTGSSEKDNIAIVASSSVSVVLTISFIVVVFIIVCRKKNIHPCTKLKKTEHVDANFTEMQGNDQQLVMDSTIDPADLQLYPVIVTDQRFEIKFGKYCSSFRSAPVMVRILPIGSSDTDAEDFYRDVDVIKGLPKHKNIVYFFGLGNNKDYSFSVFELCGSGVVLSYLRNMAESYRDHTAACMTELINICLGVINGMEFLMQKKIIHRHIAAINIFLDEKKTSKIGNFFHAVNLLSEADEVESLQLPEECEPWMAVESVSHNIYSFQTDIYAFGVFLWEVMSLGEDVAVVKSQLLENEFLPKPDGCDDNVFRLMKKCWSYNRNKRPTLQYLYQQLSCRVDEQETFDDQVTLEESANLRSTSV